MDYDVAHAVEREIEDLSPKLRDSGLAAIAMTLANQLKQASAREAAPIARQLLDALGQLKALNDLDSQSGSKLDDIRNG